MDELFPIAKLISGWSSLLLMHENTQLAVYFLTGI